MRRLCLINVGVNATHEPLRSPIFNDMRFEFVPIPEAGRRVSAPECPLLPTYDALRSFTGIPLTFFIPKRYHARRVHNDPEFDFYTYGDYPTCSPRASNLRKLCEGDYIVFFARLVAFRRKFMRRAGFYFVGFFEIEDIYRDLTKSPPQHVLWSIRSNAHVKRALWDERYWDGFWVFRGSENSTRLVKAVPLTLNILRSLDLVRCDKSVDGRTESQLIGSYLRAAKLVEGAKVEELLNYVLYS